MNTVAPAMPAAPREVLFDHVHEVLAAIHEATPWPAHAVEFASP